MMSVRCEQGASAPTPLLLPNNMEEVAISHGFQAPPRLPTGQPLVEIYSLRIRRKKGAGELRGKLKITSGNRTDCVDFCFPGESRYEPAKKKTKVGDLRGNLEVTDSLLEPHIEELPVDVAQLSGPDRAMSALMFFHVDLEFENEGMELEKEGHGPVRREDGSYLLAWHFANYDSNFYNKLREATISTRYGQVTMVYVVMENAAEAYVETCLSSVEAPAKIHGRNVAKTDFGEIVLFEKDACEEIEVFREGSIPLSRRVISVPMASKIIIGADVKEDNSDLSSYKDIGRGRAELCPGKFRTTTAVSIEGADREIEVKITWLPFNADLSRGIGWFKSRVL